MPYKRHARMVYRFISTGLAVISPIKPVFRAALWLLTGQRRQIKGHVLPLNTSLGKPVQRMLSREVLVELIGRSTAVGVMNECLCRTVGECSSFPRDLGCLVLGEAALGLHPGLGHACSREEAVAVVDRALALGLMPMVIHFKSDAFLWSLEHSRMLTVCFCCPCHCLIREALRQRFPAGEKKITGLPGVTVQLNPDGCIGCGRCAESCYVGAIAMKHDKPAIDTGLCVSCGRCAMACASGAMLVSIQDDAGATPILKEYSGRTKQNSLFEK